MDRIETWIDLNEFVLNETDESKLEALLDAELDSGYPRRAFALRIHSRLCRLRAARERVAMVERMKR